MRSCRWLCNPMIEARRDSEILDLADEVFSHVLEHKGDLRIAESTRRLFIACAAFLRDWFPENDFSFCGIVTLLSLALMQGKYDTNANFCFRKTSLDLLFKELETGRHIERVTSDSSSNLRETPSTFVRLSDGVKPADTGGLKPGTDVALSFYHSWLNSAPPQQLEESIYECINAVAWFGIRNDR